MATHFLKTLLIFIGIIALGLIGIYLVSNSDMSKDSIKPLNNKTEVAK